MHAIRLAARLGEATGQPVVPLFWIASDDHDFDEVSRLGLRTPDGSKGEVSCVPAGWREGMPVGDIFIDGEIEEAFDTLAGSLPSGQAGERYLALLKESWRPGVRWTEAFARQLAGLLSHCGLVLFDPRWEGIKPLFRDIVRTVLKRPLEASSVVNARAAEFSEHGRKNAIVKPSGSTNLFIEVEGIRHPLLFDGEIFHAGKAEFKTADLRRLADTAPERFSPDAVLRPVCQDAVMPVVATVAGPHELLYLDQVTPVYELFEVSPSLIWPRASFTVIDRRTIRYAEKEGLAPGDLFADSEQVMKKIAADTFPPRVDDALSSLEREVSGGFDRLAGHIGTVDQSLVGAVKKDLGRILHILETIRDRAIRAHKASLAVSERRLGAATSFVLPNGGLQERWYGIDAILPVLDEAGYETFIELTSPNEHIHRILIPG
jgi:bacillithiol biosynthesis cysteine-adding enzyme BshC